MQLVWKEYENWREWNLELLFANLNGTWRFSCIEEERIPANEAIMTRQVLAAAALPLGIRCKSHQRGSFQMHSGI